MVISRRLEKDQEMIGQKRQKERVQGNSPLVGKMNKKAEVNGRERKTSQHPNESKLN